MRALSALLLILGGCTEPPADHDGDGFTRADGDCDDADAAAYPGADEVCDGIDNNCDGAADLDAVDGARAYADSDGDSYGDLLSTARICGGATGYVDNPDDCDDLDPTVFPGADELCDGVDNDCDALIDEDALNPSSWYADSDGDGYGNPESLVVACAQPSGAVSDSTDCDDSNVLIHPGADEVWYDGRDQDCAGGNDYDADGDGHDADGHGGEDCDDSDDEINPSQDEVCNDGHDNDCDGTANDCGINGTVMTSDADQTWSGASSYARAGTSLARLGDTDHDGISELAIGAPYGAGYTGVVYIVPADSDGAVGSAALAELRGTTYSYAGIALDSADLDRDGYDDLIVGASGYRDGARVAGAAFVAYGPFSGTQQLDTDAVRFTGTGSNTGVSVSAVDDIDGDGLPEVAVAAPYESTGGTYYNGAARLLLSDGLLGDGDGALADSDITIAGATQYAYFGYRVEGLGDIDGDGVGDLGATGYTSQAVVFTGLTSGAYTPNDADTQYSASTPLLVGLGDIDRDGYSDFALGSSSYSSSTLSIFYGTAGTLGTAEATLSGSGSLASVSMAGDIDGDGYDSLLIGYTGTSTGTAYLIPADHTGSASVTSLATASIVGSAGDYAGNVVLGVGDVDSDGFSDIAVSAYGASGYTGEVHLFYGGGL